MSVIQAAARALLREDLTRADNQATQLREEVRDLRTSLDFVRESHAELSEQLSERGWSPLGDNCDGEPSREKTKRYARVARRMWEDSPLIKRGVEAQTNYVFGQGVAMQATDDDINAVLQAFIDDEDNRAELTEHTQMLARGRELSLDGNIFLVFFANFVSGHVHLGSIPQGQITQIISDPDNAKKPWFYKRTWAEKRINFDSGLEEVTTETRYYPDFRHKPKARPAMIGKHRVEWDMPVYHVKTGGFSDWQFGMSEVYAAIAWALKYETFLKHRAKVAETLSHYTVKAKSTGGKEGVASTKQAVKTSYARPAGNTSLANNAGQYAFLDESRELEAMNVKGATIHPDEGRRLLLMVCAHFGIPETFFGDVSVGTLATAESLDRPTELGMSNRQRFWLGVLLTIIGYVLLQAVKAPAGPLRHKARIERDADGREKIVWNEGVNPAINIEFPEIVSAGASTRIKDIVTAAAKLPNGRLIARLLLVALGVDNVDEILDETFDENGQPKQAPPATGVPATGEDGTPANNSDKQDAVDPEAK